MAQVNVNALGLSLAGRPSAGVEFEVVRDLTQADLASISAPRQAPKESRLKALRARHHRLARLLATGTKPGDAGSIVGYSASRVSILQSDPAFQELLAFYADKDQEAFMETRELLADVARDALGELQERLEDTPRISPTASFSPSWRKPQTAPAMAPRPRSSTITPSVSRIVSRPPVNVRLRAPTASSTLNQRKPAMRRKPRDFQAIRLLDGSEPAPSASRGRVRNPRVAPARSLRPRDRLNAVLATLGESRTEPRLPRDPDTIPARLPETPGLSLSEAERRELARRQREADPSPGSAPERSRRPRARDLSQAEADTEYRLPDGTRRRALNPTMNSMLRAAGARDVPNGLQGDSRSFSQAFQDAQAQGLSTFTWRGRRYSARSK